eukprot:CAMPEP_0172166310 /NCGR_PEP_ID=MMETSP1050-20130122/8910_1 /TAXON_ID=233186 /ORGANISM="Cryptomonas curvata, Strain CCAP979/52" /LENGTH=77 /DNA_ID=CAMNT_0012836905 /DNA_START=306 /DNA_END=535 /DNA_ORIENTATION=+
MPAILCPQVQSTQSDNLNQVKPQVSLDEVNPKDLQDQVRLGESPQAASGSSKLQAVESCALSTTPDYVKNAKLTQWV